MSDNQDNTNMKIMEMLVGISSEIASIKASTLARLDSMESSCDSMRSDIKKNSSDIQELQNKNANAVYSGLKTTIKTAITVAISTAVGAVVGILFSGK